MPPTSESQEDVVIPSSEFQEHVVLPRSESHKSQEPPSVKANNGSLLDDAIKDYGLNSESEWNDGEEEPVPTSLYQEETSLATVANTNEGSVGPINQVQSSLPPVTPLRVVPVPKRITRQAAHEDPQEFKLLRGQIQWYEQKYVVNSKPHGIKEVPSHMVYQCGCQEVTCFTANRNFICGQCLQSMNSYCVPEGGLPGCCRTCYSNFYRFPIHSSPSGKFFILILLP